MDQRFLTVAGASLIFATLSVALFLRLEWAILLLPLYGSLFVWAELRGESEMPVIFTFLVSAVAVAAAAHPSQAPDRVLIVAELGALLALDFGLGAHRSWAGREERRMAAERNSLEAATRDDERDIDYYRGYLRTVDAQIRLRRDLTETAKSLGGTLDAEEVHARLVSILSSRFPGARVEVVAGTPSDPLVGAAAFRKGPVLVKDSSIDDRFAAAGFRSAMAVPIKVMRQAAGYLKVESDQPSAFGPEDVRSADMLATMAAMSLENIQLYEQVHQQATHDALTQLYSHRTFQLRLQEELLRAGRSQSPLSFILCDIDHFKRYNDSYGHQAGDHLLRTLAAVLASFGRPVDTVARYGGEEFCLVLPNFVRTEAVDLANRIRQRVEAEPFVFQGHATRATMSFGVSSFPQDATTASQIVRVADERLYRAKEAGRNQVVG